MLPLMANTPIVFLNMNLYVSYFSRGFDLNTPIVLILHSLLPVCEGTGKFTTRSCWYFRILLLMVGSVSVQLNIYVLSLRNEIFHLKIIPIP